MKNKKKKKAVFLDRDGTLIKEKGYLKDPSQLELEDAADEALGLLNRFGHPAVLVTNQSGIARGYYTEEDLGAVHKELEKQLTERRVRLDAVYYCPHHPEGVREPYRQVCSCRKPGTGMLEHASGSLHIELRGSYMVGDKVTDMETALRAGLRGILVMTGYGRQEWKRCLQAADSPKPDRVARDLYEAVLWILQEEGRRSEPEHGRSGGTGPFPLWSCKWGSLAFLRERVEEYRKQGKTVVLANGVFDLIHTGHVGYLQAASGLGDVLIVAVNDDQSSKALKGEGRPVVPVEERVEILSGLACVDHCLVFWDRTVDRVLEDLRPDIHAKGTDYTESSVPERETVAGYGGRVRIVGPPKTKATTEMVETLKTIKEKP